jgi:hypothetical protein
LRSINIKNLYSCSHKFKFALQFLLKALSWILSFYFIFLFGLPCGDKEECHQENGVELVNIPHSDNGQHEHEENCPPFCSCMCCGNICAFRMMFNSISSNKPESSEKISFFKTTFLQEVPLSIWQPPKIS